MARADRDPRTMTQAELERLPTVNRIARRVASFRDHYGNRWQVGLSGNTWVKAWLGEPEP